MKSPLAGCQIELVNAAECEGWLRWAIGDTPILPRTTNCRWLLAHCDDGVTWGARREDGWRLGSSAFPDLCPSISLENLIEIRLFGDHEELLMWWDDSELRGRWLIDDPASPCDPTVRPHEEDRVLLGNDRPEAKNGFSRVADGSGREQAVPLVCSTTDFGSERQRRMPLRLTVNHYFETDSRTGAVRVAATRLVNVFNDADKKETR